MHMSFQLHFFKACVLFLNYLFIFFNVHQMMSMGRELMCQLSFMSTIRIPSVQMPHFSPCVPVGPSPGMRMVSMCNSASLPLMPRPPAYLNPSRSMAAGLHLPSANGSLSIRQLQELFIPSLALQAARVTSTAPLTFAAGFPTAFNYPNHEESCSETAPGTTVDNKQVAVTC